MTSMVLLGDSTLESLTPSVNAPLHAHAEGAAARGTLKFLQSCIANMEHLRKVYKFQS